MKRLFLLRHSEASMNAQTDRERALTNSGLQQAAALGETMKRIGYAPNFIYCSPAKRTKETLEKLGLENIKTEYPERLYNASRGDLLSFIQNASDTVDNLMVVAHNPGIHQLAGMLASEDNADLVMKLHMGYRPGTLTALACPHEKWANIEPGKNEILDYIDP